MKVFNSYGISYFTSSYKASSMYAWMILENKGFLMKIKLNDFFDDLLRYRTCDYEL